MIVIAINTFTDAWAGARPEIESTEFQVKFWVLLPFSARTLSLTVFALLRPHAFHPAPLSRPLTMLNRAR
jgi:hypothetical protein